MAKRLRVYSEIADNALTLPEFFTNRFRDNSKMLQLVSAFFILLFFLFYTSSGLVAGGKLLKPYSDWIIRWPLLSVQSALSRTPCLVVSSLYPGPTLVQGLLMAAALVLVPVIALQSGFF